MLRHKKIEQVIKEINLIKKIWDLPQISFADDNIFMDKKYSIELLEALKSLRIKWFAQTDISVAEDDRFLRLLQDSRCAILFIGFESVNRASIKRTDRAGFKYKRVAKYKDYIKKIQDYGIGIMGAFIIGFDEDRPSVFKETADFIIDNRLYAAQIAILTPLPGTALRERLKRDNRLLATPWDNYTFLDVNFIPKRMSSEELQSGLLEIYKKVYNKEMAIKRTQHFKEIYKSHKYELV